MNNELRRTILKLKVLQQTEGLNWIIEDMLTEQTEHFIKNNEFPFINDVVNKVKKKYIQYIRANTPENPKQQKLFNNE